MFLRRYTRNKDGKSHTYSALVESTRTQAGPRQHVVAYFGELNQDEQHRWQRTVVIYNRSDCKQVVLALIVTRDGFPLAHRPLVRNSQDLQTVETIVTVDVPAWSPIPRRSTRDACRPSFEGRRKPGPSGPFHHPRSSVLGRSGVRQRVEALSRAHGA